ncbi:Hypothetical protein PBC10988_41070 [Planctomycetales bacterium 10988]|nr:Hypothetical protein PBC10988_41070 [Planctomycetales bacterium 10988]
MTLVLFAVLVCECTIPASAQITWTHFQADTLILQRSRARNDVLLNADNGTAGYLNSADDIALVSAKDFDFEYEANIRFAIGFDVFPGTNTELSYWGTGFWEDEIVVDRGLTFDLIAPFDTATVNYTSANVAILGYATRSHNAEINNIWNLNTELSMLAGVRFFNQAESFSLTMGQSGGILAATSTYKVETDNYLIGPQIGFGYRVPVTPRWSIAGTAKGGFLFNIHQQNSFLLDVGNTSTLATFERSELEPSFIGEIGLSTFYRFSKGITFRLGYEVMFVNGLALAPEQFDRGPGLSAEGRDNHSGSIFFDGLLVGIEILH